MSDQETRLEMARRHVAEAELRLLRHEMIISRMEIHGQDALLPKARALLGQMQDFLRECQEHLDRELDTSKNPLRCAAALRQAFDFAQSGIPVGEVFRGVQLAKPQ